MLDLASLFVSLQPPDAGTGSGLRFTAHPIPGYAHHRIGKDEQGVPALLVSVRSGGSAQARPAPIALENLSVQHELECRIVRADGSIETAGFTVIRCAGGDCLLHSYFLQVGAVVIRLLGASPSRADVIQVIDNLVELFRAMAGPARESSQGLWAELLLISRASDVAAMVGAWHVTPEDRYDFNAGSQRIEVKSAGGRIRQHHFTLDQLKPPAGATLLIASLFTEQAGGGTSISELLGEIRARLGDQAELIMRLERVAALTLGETWRRALQERFDQELAEESLRFYMSADLPSPDPNVPPGVSDVRFRSDLTGVSSVDLAAYRAIGGLFAAACSF